MTAAATTAPKPPQLQAANFLNLLVVDDERGRPEMSGREVAQSLGSIPRCRIGRNAYDRSDAQSIDVVLLDLKLPGVGGLEALHRSRSGVRMQLSSWYRLFMAPCNPPCRQ